MKNPVLTAVSKSPLVSQYVFNKEDSIPQAFFRFFLTLDFKPDDFDLQHFLCVEDHDSYKSGEKFISIENLKDFRYNLKNDVYDVDFFIGSEKVFLVIRTKEDLQQDIADKLFKFVEMRE